MAQEHNDSWDTIADRDLLHELQIATEDLLWWSEAEYPWQVFYWQDAAIFNEHILLQQHNYSANTKIAIQQFSSFFYSTTREESWHNEEEKTEVRRYQSLVHLLAANLTDVKVYLLGEVEIEAYVLGTTEHQAIAGIQTRIVRT